MKDSNLQQAINCLAIRDVYIRESQLKISPDFDPVIPAALSVQLKIDAQNSGELNLQQPLADGSVANVTILRIHVQTAMRFIEGGIHPEQLVDLEAERRFVKAELHTLFVAEYEKKNECPELTKEAIAEFAKRNATFHVWPYWREYVGNVTIRARLPHFVLPMHQIRTVKKDIAASEPSK